MANRTVVPKQIDVNNWQRAGDIDTKASAAQRVWMIQSQNETPRIALP